MMCKLLDICEFVKGKVAVSNLTKTNYISTENMLPNRGGIVEATTLPSVDTTQTYSKGDILVSNIRPYFKKIWFATTSGGCSNDVLVFRAKKEVNPFYLYYILSDDRFFNYATATSKGTKMPRGDKIAIMNYEIEKHSRSEQDVIASILRPIDEKIALNREINNNLFEQIRALCRSMVMEREDLKLSPISDHCITVTKGTTPTTLGKPFVDKGINFVKAESILDDHSFDRAKFAFIDDETNHLLRRSIIQQGDIVYTIAGTLGRFALVDDSILPANTNQAVAIIRIDSHKMSPEYLYSLFIADWQNEYYTKHIQQAVQANLSLTTIKSLPIPILEGNEMENYISLIAPMISTMKSIEKENFFLSATRNELLPKLMSGEVDVSSIEI